MTPEVPAVAATSPGFKTLSESALLGWSPARYATGIPEGNPNSLAADFNNKPDIVNETAGSGNMLRSNPKYFISSSETLFVEKSQKIPSDRPVKVVVISPVSLSAI